MAEKIFEGGFIIARKIFESDIWIKDPLYLKTWIWIIGKANHSDNEKKGKTYKRGEFVTTYNDIIKGTSYYHNRKHIFPSIKQIRMYFYRNFDWKRFFQNMINAYRVYLHYLRTAASL